MTCSPRHSLLLRYGPVIRLTVLVCGLLALAGCGGPTDKPEVIWGQPGIDQGEIVLQPHTQWGDLARPRAVAIDSHDHLYIVDFTARIQVFDRDGHYLGRGWKTPD